MKVKKIKAYICRICDEVYEEEEEATDCCLSDKQEQIEAYKCGECDEVYEDQDAAKECCK